MWNLAGHEIVLGGGPYEMDHGDLLVIVHCCRCPDGTVKGWVLWRCEDETGDQVDPGEGLLAVVAHLREDGINVSEDLRETAQFSSALEGTIEAGLDVLSEQLRKTSDWG